MIQLPSKDQNSHNNNNHEKYDNSDDCPCDYPNLHVVFLANVVCADKEHTDVEYKENAKEIAKCDSECRSRALT